MAVHSYFTKSPEEPVNARSKIARELKKNPSCAVRMGIHSGPVKGVTDLSEQGNIAGAGINIAQRVMDCGDAGHILLSKRVADDLEQYAQWRPLLHESRLVRSEARRLARPVNLYSEEVRKPRCLEEIRAVKSARKGSSQTGARLPEIDRGISVRKYKRRQGEAYFADGIQEEILTRLSRIADLKVISRTSTQRYKNTADPIAEIAKQLGVARFSKGRSESRQSVRVNVQLIDAENDPIFGRKAYDRELTIFLPLKAKSPPSRRGFAGETHVERNVRRFRCNRQPTSRRTNCI